MRKYEESVKLDKTAEKTTKRKGLFYYIDHGIDFLFDN